jgi:ferredoxin
MQDNFLTVIKEKCVGCGLCIKACPKQVISLRNRNEAVQIRCHSGDAKSVAKNCKFGCIACGICVKSCPKKAVSIKEIAAIDYSKCDSCGTCAKVCPRKVIEQLQGG